MIDPKLKPVADAIRAGNANEAIRLLREATGMGLAEATEAVERLSAEEKANPSVEDNAASADTSASATEYDFAREVGNDLQALRAPRDPNTQRLDAGLASEVLPLVRANKYLDAIKLVRARRGADLKTAKDQVEMVMEDNGIAKPGNKGCLMALVGLLFIVGVLVFFLSR